MVVSFPIASMVLGRRDQRAKRVGKDRRSKRFDAALYLEYRNFKFGHTK